MRFPTQTLKAGLLIVSGLCLAACAERSQQSGGEMIEGTPTLEHAPDAAPEASSPPDGAEQKLSNAGSYLVSYVTHPLPIPLNEMFTIEFWVRPMLLDISEIEELEIEVDARMPHHHHGMYRVPRVNKLGGAGHYEAEGMLFHMPGYWEIYFDISHEGVTERAQFSVEID